MSVCIWILYGEKDTYYCIAILVGRGIDGRAVESGEESGLVDVGFIVPYILAGHDEVVGCYTMGGCQLLLRRHVKSENSLLSAIPVIGDWSDTVVEVLMVVFEDYTELD